MSNHTSIPANETVATRSDDFCIWNVTVIDLLASQTGNDFRFPAIAVILGSGTSLVQILPNRQLLLH